MPRVVWTSKDVDFIARHMFKELEGRTFNKHSHRIRAFQVAYSNAQATFPHDKRKIKYTDDYSGVSEILNSLLEGNKVEPPSNTEEIKTEEIKAAPSAVVPAPIAKPVTKPVAEVNVAKDMEAFFDLLEERLLTEQQTSINRLAPILQQLSNIEATLASYNFNGPRPTAPVAKAVAPTPVVAPTLRTYSICIVNLLQSQHKDILSKAKHLPIEIEFLHSDHDHSLPKTKRHDLLIYTRHGNESSYKKLHNIYGKDGIAFVNGGMTSIIKRIEKFIASNNPQ